MSNDFDSILDQCIEAIQSGASIESCLARFPEHAESLQPLLLTAATVNEVPTPQASPLVMERSQQRMLVAFEAKSGQAVSNSLFHRYTGQLSVTITSYFALLTGKEKNKMTFIVRFATVAILVIILVSTTGGAALASTNALPGDALYPIKTSVEQFQLILATDPDKRQQLENQFQENRIDEVQAILEDGRNVNVKFYGELIEISETYLNVGGLKVMLDSNSVIQGPLGIGFIVEVEAEAQSDGTLLALVISVEDSFADPFDHSLTETPDPSETPELTETPEPTDTPEFEDDDDEDETPEPSNTPEPGDDDDEDETPEPTDTPEPGDDDDDEDETPEPTDTPEPGDDDDEEDKTPEPTNTPGPGDDDDEDETPEPSNTPKPGDDDDDEDETPEPSNTPKPGDDDDEDEAPEPTNTPEPGDDEEDETPEPSETPDPDDD